MISTCCYFCSSEHLLQFCEACSNTICCTNWCGPGRGLPQWCMGDNLCRLPDYALEWEECSGCVSTAGVQWSPQLRTGGFVSGMYLPVHSGVARLGHTGACALATRGRAPPVLVHTQIIVADSSIVDRKSGAKQFRNQTAQYHYTRV